MNDNIVAFWVPKPRQGWRDARICLSPPLGDLPPNTHDDLAHILETRIGHGGVSGVENKDGSRKFVIDFKGGLLGNLPGGSDVKAIVNVTGGEIVTQILEQIWGTDVWRLVVDVVPSEKILWNLMPTSRVLIGNCLKHGFINGSNDDFDADQRYRNPFLPMEELMYDGATLAAGACALPDAPMAMPVQVIERSASLFQRMFSPAHGRSRAG